MISDSFFDETDHESMSDIIKMRANRISELFPPCTLAYSFLLKSRNFKLSKDELFEKIIQFPQVDDARRVFLSPSDTRLFGFQDIDFFQVPIKEFINFSPDELIQILDNSYFYVGPNEVWLEYPPEIDIEHTLLVYRHLYPQMSNQDFIESLNRPRFIAYFHYHKLEIDLNNYEIPSLQPEESFFYFKEQPQPEYALLNIFCANRTDNLPFLKIQEIKRNTTIFIGPEKKPLDLAVLLGDLIELITNCHFFEFVDDRVQAYPPLFFSTYFNYNQPYTYQANGAPCLIRSPTDTNTTEEDDSIMVDPAVSSKIFPYIEKLMADIGDDVPNFTHTQIFQHVAAQYFGCDQHIYHENASISIEEIKNGISKWVQENAQRDLLSKLKNEIQWFENETKKMLEARKQSLNIMPDIRTDELMERIGEEYPFLKPDQDELEYELELNDSELYKLKEESFKVRH
ncbi:hypothetical protein TRFO_06518 [Tritrichomonas foetus]|uniref:Uncharacterized protein n=1 Tax=Tritrichomonas foetus TaxID=1144522 RepID=A0A1J4K1U2_9EUKA|nr:hypothetical protein TRFO_06518 [Tritrichomonas foetus]|eukprot:OHT03710.1 hypothetical protein TRFO_06518 [Tritrichomonas foetus]